MLAFRRQPFKLLFFAYSVITILFIRVPFWIILSSIPAWRQRRSWTMYRAFTMRFINATINVITATGAFEVDIVDAETSAKSAATLGFVWVDGLPDHLVRGEVAEMAKSNCVAPNRTSGYWYGRKGPDGRHAQPASPGEKVLYYMHGGGHIMGSGAPTAGSAPAWFGILEHCSDFIDRVFCLDYRLSSGPPLKPENPFPASIIDVLSGYHYLINVIGFKPQDIIVGGDSAGGHLALVLARYLACEKIESLPLPSAMILLSPAVDWSHSHKHLPSSSIMRNSQTDIIFEGGYTVRAILGSLDPDEVNTNPWISPASLNIPNPSGLFKGLPPTWILSGSLEMGVDEMRTLRDRLQHDIGKDRVTYLEYPDAIHDFLAFTWHEPERTEALKELRKWISRLL